MAQNFSVMVFGPTTATKTAFTSSSGSTVVDTGASNGRIAFTCDQDCHIVFGSAASGGSAPSATTSSFPIWAKTTVIFDIAPNRRYFAVVRDSADGSLYWGPVQ